MRITLQDLLELGFEARMATPGVAGGNRQWRFTWSQFTDAIRDRFTHMTRSTVRKH